MNFVVVIQILFTSETPKKMRMDDRKDEGSCQEDTKKASRKLQRMGINSPCVVQPTSPSDRRMKQSKEEGMSSLLKNKNL